MKPTSSQIFGGTLNFSLPFAVDPRRPRRNPVGKGERGKKNSQSRNRRKGKKFSRSRKKSPSPILLPPASQRNAANVDGKERNFI